MCGSAWRCGSRPGESRRCPTSVPADGVAAGGACRVCDMSTPQHGYRIPLLVPGYLLVVGVGLLAGSALLLIYSPDEVFTAVLAAVGGVTMLVTMLLTLTWARTAN